MRRSFHRDERGQSLLLVAGGFAMLLVAVAFSVDWGYGFAQRRAMTNGAQSGALAAGRMLATSVTFVQDPVTHVSYPAFPADTKESVYKEACRFFLQNLGPNVTSESFSMTVAIVDNTGADLGTVSESFSSVSSTCNAPATSTTIATTSSTQTVDVKVSTGITYHTLFGGEAGVASTSAGGYARARVSGAPLSPPANGGGVWPIVRQFFTSDFSGGPCASPCDPSGVQPLTFWDSSGSFKSLVDFSEYSPNNGSNNVPQLQSQWDQSHSHYAGTAFTTDQSGNGCNQTGIPGWTNGHWDTSGQYDGNKGQCSIPNWAFQGFGGSLSVSKDWTDPNNLTGQQEAPNNGGALPTTRSACQNLPAWVTAPSCANGRFGDWVESTTANGNYGQNIAQGLCAYIRARPDPANAFERTAVPGGGNSACQGNTYPDGGSYTNGTYGRSRTVWVFLWDCVETFKGNGTLGASQWDPNFNANDCQTPAGNKINRVHLFAVAPFTFYEGLINSSTIRGFWGGAFGSPDSCRTSCVINALSNTTFLVGD